MERLTANNATYTLRAVDRLVAERVLDAEQRQAITQKIVEESVQLTDARGKTRFTTREVLAAEQTLATAANGLATQRRDVAIERPADGRDGVKLDEHQQRAYAYATDDDARLKVITGVPGAGKTRLINEVAAAYAEAGYTIDVEKRSGSIANAVEILPGGKHEGAHEPGWPTGAALAY
jgi:ATP-dependent exoDNAse (exonuclease V) alpha subunit